jgi:plastocyanin
MRVPCWPCLMLLAGSPALAGDVVGVVRFSGAAAPLPPLATTKDRAVCGTEVEDESLLLQGDRLANVVLVVSGARGTASPATLTLDQRRCRFRPRVQVAPVGSTLEAVNGDRLLHSVHGWAGRMTRFDLVLPADGMRAPARLDRAGLIEIRCDVHSWMSAYVMVSDAPAAVSGPDGAFAMRGVPAGTYQLTAWHERLGERQVAVTVPQRGEARLEVTFGR